MYKNKYSAVKQTYNGTSYHSKKEAQYAFQLDMLIKAGEIKSWTGQKRIEIYVDGKKICNHFVDFEVTLPDGTIEWHEVKGFATDVWILKRKLVEALFPYTKYKVIR